MFSESKKYKADAVSPIGLTNRLVANTKIKGDITADTDFRIDGVLEGSIKTKGKVVIGKTGYINGKVMCENADIEGKFNGELNVSNILTLKSSANIQGNVIVGKLSVEPGANFNATCDMKGAGVKELKATSNNEQKTEKTA
ncbi:bactofilin family protein [Abyssalbus ytuae]|uniref:Polymer-forming cytoskeletal protein n=1 Tax=Abyssalbus ytuae TaxID=2926907 RepID=A0A9E6ZNW9_9FLAO|nr:polymer-forming cytoskeletal protein [Abyssalbus ytuae]UOB16008.1 polymer-forming cytoskeletal protein [Abyssalbus ytuae]